MNSKLEVNPVPLLQAYQQGGRIVVQFGPLVTDQTMCLMEVAQALIQMASNHWAQERNPIQTAPAGMRVSRID